MQIEYEDNEIVAATDEEFAAKYAAVLMKAIHETSVEAEVSICFLGESMIRTIVLNAHMNGHGPCAAVMLAGATKYLADLEGGAAQASRH